MATVKITITVPNGLVQKARQAVRAGRAKNVSTLVTEALDYWLDKNALGRILDEMDDKYGRPGPEAKKWVDQLWRAKPPPAR